jgi:hypothetical protein
VKWLAGALGFSEPHMRELLRTKTPPGFVRSKGDRWIIKGPVTARRLADLRRLYGVAEPPEMTMQTLEEFDASYEEFALWSKGVGDAERAIAAHPLLGPVYHKMAALQSELALTPPELVAARQALLDAASVTPLDEQYWQSPRKLVLDAPNGHRVALEAAKFPKKFLIIAALQNIRSRHEPAPTFVQLAGKLRINRSTLFRWARASSVDLRLAIATIFDLDATYGTASAKQETDLRIQHFGRRNGDWH